MIEAVTHQNHLRTLSSAIVRAIPGAAVGLISDVVAAGVSSMLVRCPNGALVFIANDLDGAETSFLVACVTLWDRYSEPGTMAEDATAAVESVAMEDALALVRGYAGFVEHAVF